MSLTVPPQKLSDFETLSITRSSDDYLSCQQVLDAMCHAANTFLPAETPVFVVTEQTVIRPTGYKLFTHEWALGGIILTMRHEDLGEGKGMTLGQMMADSTEVTGDPKAYPKGCYFVDAANYDHYPMIEAISVHRRASDDQWVIVLYAGLNLKQHADLVEQQQALEAQPERDTLIDDIYAFLRQHRSA